LLLWIDADAHFRGGFMRLFSAIRATVLLVSTAAATSHADSLANADPASSGGIVRPRFAACDCPGYRWGLRQHHYRRSYARQFQGSGPAPELEPAEPPDSYNPLLPSTYDTAYDRAMTLHFRSPAVTDTYLVEPGWPPTPPVRGVFPYRVRAWGGVYQYDGLVGQYIALAQSDARRVTAAVPIPP
jgi:hypothetical protein